MPSRPSLLSPRALAAAAVCALFASCYDVALPDGARIACVSNDECPPDYECRAVLGLCVQARSDDDRPPALVSATVEPAVARVGETVTVVIEVDEPLILDPQVTLALDGAERSLVPVVVDGAPVTQFTLRYVASGDEGEGDKDLRAMLVDSAGNAASDVPLGRVTFDFTPPSLADAVVSPALARAGDEVTLTLRTSEPLADGSTATIVGGRAFTLAPAGDDPLVHAFTLVPDAAIDAEGPAAVAIVVTDAAGNATNRVLDAAVTFDFTAPSVAGDVVIPRPVVSGGQVLVIAVPLSEPVAQVAAALVDEGGSEVPLTLDSNVGSQVSFRREIADADVDGTYALRLTTLVDAAGNAADPTDLAATVVVDQHPPQLVGDPTSAPLVASHAAGLDVVNVSFTLDESADVTVTLGADEAPCAAEGVAPAVTYTCVRGLADSDVDGVRGVTITAVDAAGNSSFATAPAVTYDFTAPVALVGVVPDREARRGEVISLSATADEVLDPASVVVSAPGLGFSTPVTAGRATTATLTVPPGLEGSFEVSVTVADLGGNVAAPITHVIDIDGVAPTLSASSLSSARVAPGETFTLTVRPSEALAQTPTVTFANGDTDGTGAPVIHAMTLSSGPSPSNDYVFSAAGPASGLNQFYTITVVMEDGAGNPGADSPAVIVVDNAPPSLAGFDIAPLAARAGDTVRVVVTADETLAGPPSIVARALALQAGPSGSGGASFAMVPTQSAAGAISYVFTMPITGATAQGTWTFDAFSLVDEADNAGSVATNPARAFTVDSVAPTIANVSLSRTKVKAGVSFDVSFTTSEPVGTPAVMVGASPMTLVTSSGSTSFTFRYTATGAEDEGLEGVTLSVADAAGNVGVAGAEVDFDFSAPALLSTSATPSVAKTGTVLAYTVTADEALTAAPTLTVGGAGSLPLTFQTGTTYVYAYTVTGAEPQGARTVSVSMQDLAGNTASASGAGFTLDTATPTVSALSVTPSRASRVSGRNVVTATFTLSENVGSGLVVRVGGALATCSNTGLAFTCTYTVQASDTAGTKSVVVQATDSAGNVGFASSSVEYDFTAPGLLSTTVTPSVAKPGDVVTYTVAANEALASTPTISTSGASPVTLTFASGTQFSFQYAVTGAETSGARTVQLGLVDVAGNTATINAPTAVGFTLDTVAPTLSAVSLSRSTISRVASFNTSTITFTASDNLSSSPTVLVKVGDNTVSCTNVGSAFTCAYTAQASDVDGASIVLVTATDAAGNVRTASASLAFDFTAPAVLGTSAVTLTPASGNPLSSPTAVTTGTSVRVGFTMSEPLGAVPTVRTSTTPALSFAVVTNTNPSFTFSHTLAASPPTQGTVTVQVVAADAVGNSSTSSLTLAAPGFVIDTVVPSVPAVGVSDRIVYTRTPWGDNTGVRRFKIDGTAGAVENGAVAIAYDGTNVAAAAEIARAQASATGAFAMTLDNADRASVFLAVVDAAGNASDASGTSGTQATAVRDITWLANMGSKVPGSFIANPHTFESRREVESRRSQPDAEETGQLESTAPANRVSLLDGQTTTTSGAPSWREVSSEIPATFAPRIAYDAERAVVVMPAGSTGILEWDGTRWNEVDVKDPEGDGEPGTGSGFALAYDPVHALTIMWGGISMGETWGWNGNSWALLAAEDDSGVDAPSPRLSPAIAWDEADERILLFGGERNEAQIDPCAGNADACLGDLWAWDGETWSEVGLPGGPSARTGATMVFNDDGGDIVLFGGENQDGYQSDTYTWAGGWSQQQTSAVPARTLTAMVHDAQVGGVIMLGGLGNSGNLSDQWFWDGGDWSLMTPSDPEKDGNPSARSNYGLAHDTARDVYVIFGGDGNTTSCSSTGIFCDDTWLGTSSSWQRVGAVNTTASLPMPRRNAGAAYDRVRGKSFMFGGTTTLSSSTDTATCTSGGSCLDLWEWDGARWTKRTQSGTVPGKRTSVSMAYDELTSVTVLFGGQGTSPCDGSVNAFCDGTFELNGTTGAWTRFLPSPRPSARSEAAMAHDAGRGRVVLFGGSVSFARNGETWEWNGSLNTWTQRCTAAPSSNCGTGTPTARVNAAMAYDRTRGVTVLWGGDNTPNNDDDNVFEWNGTTGVWTRLTPTDPEGDGSPVARMDATLVYDEVRRKIVLMGDPGQCFPTATTDPCNDLWEWNGTSWRNIEDLASPSDDGVPAPRSMHNAVYDAARGETLLFAGDTTFDTWRENGGGSEAPAHVFHVDFSAAQPGSGTVRDVTLAWTVGATATPSGSAVNGAMITALRQGQESVVAFASGSATVPATSTTTITNLTGLFSPDDELVFMAQPQGLNGNGSSFGSVTTDYVEARVRYRLP